MKIQIGEQTISVPEGIEVCIIEEAHKEQKSCEKIIDEWGDTHDPILREKINDAWGKEREMFCPILKTLYARDIDEITDSDAILYDEFFVGHPSYGYGCETGNWDKFRSFVLDAFTREWDFWAYFYLNHMADDTDLECILKFLHY